MVYLLRFIIWFIVIAIISWILHYKFKKYVKYEKLKPFTGVMIFFVIMLTPMTIAKTAQLYYCWKYKPFYKIIKPLPEDFEGFYYGKDILSAFNCITNIKKYDNIIKYADYSDYNSTSKKTVYYRYYIDDINSSYCRHYKLKKPGDEYYFKEDEKFNKMINNLKNQNKCIARKIIPKSEVSKYMVGFYDDTIVDIYPFQIPGIVRANYYKFKVVMNRLTREYYAWRAGVRVEWDLYGVLGHEGAKPTFGCWSGVNVVDKLIKSIKQRGENNGK